jgi:hypothetical protein
MISNDERSQAGPMTSGRQHNVRPALAAAIGWAMSSRLFFPPTQNLQKIIKRNCERTENDEKLRLAISVVVHAPANGTEESQKRKTAQHQFAAFFTGPGCSEQSHFQTRATS